LVNIFIIGSALKGKEKPNDVDLITVFRDKDYGRFEEINYKIKKIGDDANLKLHIEPLLVDNLINQEISSFVLHEGFSIKDMGFVNDIIGFESYLLITYDLDGKTASDKVRFSYALYGRKKGEGFIKELKGKSVGKGALMVPVGKQSGIHDFFGQWGVSYKEKRMLIINK